MNIALLHSSRASLGQLCLTPEQEALMPLSQAGNPTWGQPPNGLPVNVILWIGIMGGLEDLNRSHS